MPHRFLSLAPAAFLLLFAGFWNPPTAPSSYDSARWIEQGLAHERAGELPIAEHDLLEAARVDKLFQPSWTLANYYFRHGQAVPFWHWSRQALAVGTRDLGALFDLCWQITQDPEAIWSAVIPHRKAVWNEYLMYLMQSGKWPAAALASARLASAAVPGDLPLLLGYCDTAIQRGDREPARVVWKSLCLRGVLPYRPGALLTNRDLRVAPTGRGFDWSVPAVPGVSHHLENGEVEFTLNGDEPEEAVLLRQPLALAAGGSYRLSFEYRTSGISPDSGLLWEAGGRPSPVIALDGWTPASFFFTGDAPALSLVYRRAPGTTLAVGSLSLRRMDIAAQ